jgi:hypothetical protein
MLLGIGSMSSSFSSQLPRWEGDGGVAEAKALE